MIYKFCPKCGQELERRNLADDLNVPYCVPCSKAYFSFSEPCIIAAVFNEFDEIAVVKQHYPPTSRYSLVAGHVTERETIEECAVREIREEIGQLVESAHFIRSYYFELRDQLMFSFICRVKKSDIVISAELDDAMWVPLSGARQYIRGSIGLDLLEEYERVFLNREILE